MEKHPGCAEPVPEHGEAGGEERLLLRHEGLTAFREHGKHAIGVLVATRVEECLFADDGPLPYLTRP